MPNPRLPLWQQLLQVAAKTVIDAHDEAQAKKQAADEEASKQQRPNKPPAPIFRPINLGLVSGISTATADQPSHKDRVWMLPVSQGDFQTVLVA